MSFYSVRHPDEKPMQDIFKGIKIERGEIMGGIMGIGRYDGPKEVEATERSPDLVTNLKRQLEYHASEMHKIREMLILLERNPDFEKMINLSRGLL